MKLFEISDKVFKGHVKKVGPDDMLWWHGFKMGMLKQKVMSEEDLDAYIEKLQNAYFKNKISVEELEDLRDNKGF